MARRECGGEAVGGGEEAILRGDAGEGLQGFLREGGVAGVVSVRMHAEESHHRHRIGAGGGGILEGLAADIEAAEGRGIGGAVEEAAGFGVTVAFDGEIEGALGGAEIAGVERGLVSIEQREDARDLIVERTVERGAADAVAEAAVFAPDFFQHAVERLQGEGSAALADHSMRRTAEHARGFQIRRDEHGVPGGVHGLVHVGRGALEARREQLRVGVGDGQGDLRFVFSKCCGDLRGGAGDPQDVLRRIVVHLAVRLDVVVQLHHPRFLGGEDGAQLLPGPGEVVAVVVEGDIGVLAGVEAATRLVGEHFVDPVKDALGGLAEKRIVGDLPAVQIVAQQLGIVVAHLFEVRHEPALVHGVAVETTGELVIDAAAGHFDERRFGHGEEVFLLRLLVALEDKVQRRRVGKLRSVAEAAVLAVEELHDGADLGVHHGGIEAGARAGKTFGLGHRGSERLRGALELFALGAVSLSHGQEDATEAGAAHAVFGREIGAAKKGLAVGKEKTGEGPAALAGEGADGGLVACVHVGALVAIHFDGDEVLVDQGCDLGVLVALTVNDVAPVAPDGADIEEDGLVFGAGPGKDPIAPFVPVDRLMRSGAQVGAGGILEMVLGMCGQG